MLLRMAKLDNLLLRSKFRGSMLGALMGDCLGAPFEGDDYMDSTKTVVQNYFDKMEKTDVKVPIKQYTDDTAMMKSIAKCLIEKQTLDCEHLAKLFVVEFFNAPKRGYGQNVVSVFEKLRREKFADIYKPAREQFGGSGSYGNGGAMRIAPIALYFYNNYDAMIDATTKSTEITHSNKLGIHGALLQCIAIQQSLLLKPEEQVNPVKFTEELIMKMKAIEVDDGLDLIETPYQDQLNIVKEMISVKPPEGPVLDEEVVQLLGHSISALYSVPTAIYCFLKAQSDISDIKTENLLRRTIQYAISLGGDTDTIACMAGAIAGAQVGYDGVNIALVKQCEFAEDMDTLAEQLHEAVKS